MLAGLVCFLSDPECSFLNEVVSIIIPHLNCPYKTSIDEQLIFFLSPTAIGTMSTITDLP